MLRLIRSTRISLAGLLVGVAGLVVQWIADPAKFDGNAFPPGIAFIVAAGLLVLLTARWWWHAGWGVFIAFWIVVGGTLADQMTPNLTSDNVGTVAGTTIMAAGLVLAFIAGILSMRTALRTRRAARSEPDRVPQR